MFRQTAATALVATGKKKAATALATAGKNKPAAATKKVLEFPLVKVEILLHEVMLHLPPRQVYKLMLANKTIKGLAKEHHYYWDRSAAHVAYMFYVDLPEGRQGYMLMKGLDAGYHRAMEHFMQLVRTWLRQHFDLEAETPREMILCINQAARMQRYKFIEKNITPAPRLITPLLFKLTAEKILKDHAECMQMQYVRSAKMTPEMEMWNKLHRKTRRFSNRLEDDGQMTPEQKKRVAKWVRKWFVFGKTNWRMGELVTALDLLKGSKHYDYLGHYMDLTRLFVEAVVPGASQDWVLESIQDMVLPDFLYERDIESEADKLQYMMRLSSALRNLKPNTI